MLRKNNFRHVRQANTANQHSGANDDVIRRMKATADWKQEVSEPFGHCAACNPKRSLQLRNEEKHNS